MATCKDCVKYDTCKYAQGFNAENDIYPKGGAETCATFKPAADVVEVVRCKDCIHWWSPMEDDFHYCRLKTGLGGLVTKEDYCSFATRTPKEKNAEK